MTDYRKQTLAVRSGIGEDVAHGAVVPPIYLSTNYTFAGYGEKRKYDYSRSGNPTRDQLGHALAALEGGVGSVITGTGMGAINLAALAVLKADDLLVAPHDCYGGTYRLFQHMAARGSYRVLFVDQGDPVALAAALAQQPKLVWVETPSNPLLRLVDIEVICQQAHAVGALVAVDNTFLSPVLQRPLALGADIVAHSTTKYLNGHSDVVGGALVARDPALLERLAWWGNCLGHTGSAFDAYLTLRGLRTLGPRMRAHQENATAIVQYLQQQSVVKKVYYPGLPDHPGHEIAQRQQQGFGAMVSFEVNVDLSGMQRFLGALQLFSLAESLGGVESLVAHPASMTHAGMDPDARRVAGISDQLLRLSVGIEDAEDLMADLAQAFAQV